MQRRKAEKHHKQAFHNKAGVLGFINIAKNARLATAQAQKRGSGEPKPSCNRIGPCGPERDSLSEERKQNARGDRRTDHTGHVGTHGVHQQEVRGIGLLPVSYTHLDVYKRQRAVLNLAGLAALLPVLTLVLDPAGFEGDGPLATVYVWSGVASPRTFALAVCGAVVGFIVLKCGVNFLLARAERRYIYDLYRTLSRRLYIAYHDRGLAFINNSNSSVLARNVNVVCLAFAAGVLRPAAAMIALSLIHI